MNLRDFFRKPITTHCAVQGIEQAVTVTAEYHPPQRREPVCCKCLRRCSVVELDNPWNDEGGQLGYNETMALSSCCRAGYTMGPEAPAEHEQVEALDVWNARGVSIMDGMYLAELCELEDRLLTMAKADLEQRKADAAAFAREVREEALAVGQAQRGVRV